MEQIEVYPFQRIKETPGKRWLEKKAQLSKMLKRAILRRFPHGINLSQLGNSLLRVEVLILCLMAFVMARASLLGELLPFMFAFIAAFGRRQPVAGLAMGLAASIGLINQSAHMGLMGNITSILLLISIINYSKLPAEKYWWGIPFVCTATIFLVKSLFLVKTGMSFYGEMVIIFESLMAGILSFVFIVSSDAIKKKKKMNAFAFEDIAAFLILGIGVVIGLDGFQWAGLSISSILCRLGILAAAWFWGAGQATMVGVMVGLIPSINSSTLSFTLGLYTVSGLLAGLFRSLGRLGIVIGFMLGTMGFSLFIPETQATVLGIWETAVACLIFFLLPESLNQSIKKIPALSLVPNGEGKISQAAECMRDEARERLRGVARVFNEIASTLQPYDPPSCLKKEEACLNYLYEEISSGICYQCLHYQKCWEKYCYKTSKELLDLFTIAERMGSIVYEQCPPDFRRSCLYSRDIVNLINYLYASLRLNQYWKNRLDESCGMISRQIQGISRVIENLADDYDDKTHIDYDLKDKIKKSMKKMDFKLLEITPVRRANQQLYIKIIMGSCTDGQYCASQVSTAVSAVLGEKFEVTERNCPCLMGKGNCEFTLNRACTYRVRTGVAQVGKENVCGDSYTVAALHDCRELIALSDGMGIGEEAFTQSRSAIRMLESLLEAGFDKAVALDTINSTLLLKSTREDFATLDIAMIDLYTAEADFIKTGGVPSFLKRGGQVELISASSLPVGIVETMDVYNYNRRLAARDLLVMISDGVLDFTGNKDEDNTLWIQELLKIADGDPQLIAEMIINRALSRCQGKPSDDMTVICCYLDLNLPD
ncbi:MAG: stage II sporulation protein E [Syntrophomonadaceae bacterium]|jgi:stage II sporulation protein E|nr:stage II sporulation protein E [Syntrophomonadaceae bacterium]